MEYSPLVRNHFMAPRNVGRLGNGANVLVASAGNKEQGTEIVLSARIEHDRLAALTHLAYGCPHTIAAASWATERLVGKSLDELRQWKWREVATALEVPPEKWGRLLVLEDAVRALERSWGNRLSNHAQTA
jgi:NifU-like protein involved in Fe-S cluster formation